MSLNITENYSDTCVSHVSISISPSPIKVSHARAAASEPENDNEPQDQRAHLWQSRSNERIPIKKMSNLFRLQSSASPQPPVGVVCARRHVVKSSTGRLWRSGKKSYIHIFFFSNYQSTRISSFHSKIPEKRTLYLFLAREYIKLFLISF